MKATYAGLALLSAAGLLLEISLTRLFALAQFYHFAFMAVSLALLGFGASGSLLALRPAWCGAGWERRLSGLALAFALAAWGSYLLANALPFDSFSIAWDARQPVYLALYFTVPALPFICVGLAVGLALAALPARASRIYAANLAGSAVGCLLAIGFPLTWGPGAVAFGAALGAGAGFIFAVGTRRRTGAVLNLLALLGSGVLAVGSFPWLDVRLSPYKGLRQALLYPGARVVASRWNAFSRVDLVESAGVRRLPGLSYAYSGTLPAQWGLTVDGDDLAPVPLTQAGDAPPFADYLPAAAAYHLRPGARALIVEPRGGLDVLAARQLGAQAVTAVEGNPLVLELALQAAPTGIYADPRVTAIADEPRAFLRRTAQRYDVVQLSLAQPFRPVTSGAYSLAEDFHLTTEACAEYLAGLEPGGLLVITRWLQSPPSEDLRTLALVIAGLERVGIRRPEGHILAWRGIQTVTLLARREPFTPAEIERVRSFLADRRFDLIVAPGLREEEANRFNIQREAVHYRAFNELLSAPDRRAYVAAYPFAIAPPTDDKPFFNHFFRWGQTPTILRTLGKTWQPFGGSGYFVLLMLLFVAIGAATLLILLPLRFWRGSGDGFPRSPAFLYFALLGLAFLLVEIPLIGRALLALGQPAYALAAVLFSLLVFSGLGSLAAPRVSWPGALAALVIVALLVTLIQPSLLYAGLGWPLPARFALVALTLAPLGFLMGIPFPKGIAWLEKVAPSLIPWAWAVNGSVSVVASVLAALLIVSWGYSRVLGLGAAGYAVALVLAMTVRRSG
jgi:hypothetical protein